MNIELGGGSIPIKLFGYDKYLKMDASDFINVDCFEHPNVDRIVDLNKGRLPFDNNSVDNVYSSHCLEHLEPTSGFLHCMEELYRVSKPNARWFIKVPYAWQSHSLSNPFHINNTFTEATFYFFSDEPRSFGPTTVRKGSVFESHIKCTLEVMDIQYKYYPEYTNLTAEEAEEARKKYINVVDEIQYWLRVQKPDFWVLEAQRRMNGN